MSDPVTNSEVEDVLSSIRRLVSDNKRPKADVQGAEPTERLILTPHQRVSDLDTLQLTPEDAVPPHEAQAAFDEPPLQEELVEEFDDGHVVELTNEQEEAYSEDETLEEADTNLSTETSVTDEDETDASQDNETIESESSAADPSALSEKIAALETAIARSKDQWDPDGDEADAFSGAGQSLAMTWQDDVDLDATGKPMSDDEQGEETIADEYVPDAIDEDDAQLIDEETLLQMIREIVQRELAADMIADAVRAELQGDLGARITSNIRKLVRREIQLAMASQGLE